MPELSAGALRSVLDRLAAAGPERARAGLEVLAQAVVERARTNASNGSHAYGTPTPAQPGQGPARISGTLVDSIAHSPVVPGPLGLEVQVGPQAGHRPPYGSTPADRYGRYLETGLRNGATYPWLKPAAEAVGKSGAALAFSKAFGNGWADA